MKLSDYDRFDAFIGEAVEEMFDWNEDGTKLVNLVERAPDRQRLKRRLTHDTGWAWAPRMLGVCAALSGSTEELPFSTSEDVKTVLAVYGCYTRPMCDYGGAARAVHDMIGTWDLP
jgi:hypothetical protein